MAQAAVLRTNFKKLVAELKPEIQKPADLMHALNKKGPIRSRSFARRWLRGDPVSRYEATEVAQLMLWLGVGPGEFFRIEAKPARMETEPATVAEVIA